MSTHAIQVTPADILRAALERYRASSNKYPWPVIWDLFQAIEGNRRAERPPYHAADRLLFRALNRAGFPSYMDFDRRGTKEDGIAAFEAAIADASAGKP